jgi:hypothetical protein
MTEELPMGSYTLAWRETDRLGVDEEFLSIRHTDLVENVRQVMTDRTV